MAVHLVTPSVHVPDLSREILRRRKISGPERDSLGAFRGFAFAILIEVAFVLLGGVGWELWRMIR